MHSTTKKFASTGYDNHIVEVWDSPLEMAEELIRKNPDMVGRDYPNFVGRQINDWQQVQRLLGEVWTEGLAVVERMLVDLEKAELPPPQSIKRRQRFSADNGDEFDYDRFKSGQDAYWRSSGRDKMIGNPIIKIVVNISGNCNVNPMDLLWSGAASIALTEILENAGYRVELWAATTGSKCFLNGNRYTTFTCLKESTDPVDTAAIVNGVSGWFFRTAIIGMMECQKNKHTINHGYAQKLQKDMLEHIDCEDGFLINQCSSQYEAVAVARYILDQIAKG